ncbi:MAG: hypothetical protein O2909_03885 [Chloroflexi bacterium]|nr:hypothetical protein [Chloroflexota bacterium]MDA1218562.1 hypothetical protein [Chloroflexota bacterium]
MINRNLGDYGFNRRHLREGGGRGNGNDHLDELAGCTELYIYQTPNRKVQGYDSLKIFAESEGCEVIFTADAPPELSNYETMRITHRRGEKIPDAVVKRAHSWAHNRNFLHSFFKPMYR